MGTQLVKDKFSGKQMNKRLMFDRSTSNHPLASCSRTGVTLCRSYPLTQSYQLNESLLQSGIVKNKARYEELKITLSTHNL